MAGHAHDEIDEDKHAEQDDDQHSHLPHRLRDVVLDDPPEEAQDDNGDDQNDEALAKSTGGHGEVR